MNKFKPTFFALRHGSISLLLTLACGHVHSTTSCAINSAVLAFGNYQVFNTQPTDSIGTVELVCTNLDSVASSGAIVMLGISASANGSSTNRKMSGNGTSINYSIYSDASRTRNWAEGSTAPQLPTGTLQAHESKPLRFTLYGRIPPLQNANVGAYHDTLAITVTP